MYNSTLLYKFKIYIIDFELLNFSLAKLFS